jgi:hypothetical protein
VLEWGADAPQFRPVHQGAFGWRMSRGQQWMAR